MVAHACPTCKSTLIVTVIYRPMPRPIEGAEVTISGPSGGQQLTDADGKAVFANIEPGVYEVRVTYGTGDPAADAAEAQIGSTAWAEAVRKDDFPAGSYKCNLFVSDMVVAGGRPRPEVEVFSVKEFVLPPYGDAGRVRRRPLAAEWAGEPIGGYGAPFADDPEPGDVVAEDRNLNPIESRIGGFTGHTGIVGYPI